MPCCVPALLLWLLQAVSMGGVSSAVQLSVLTTAVADSLTQLFLFSLSQCCL